MLIYKILCREIIFETKQGHKEKRIVIETLIPKSIIHPKVIDIWSMVLNDEEKRKSTISPLRFYFPTDMIVSHT